jgi:hypothetical protein
MKSTDYGQFLRKHYFDIRERRVSVSDVGLNKAQGKGVDSMSNALNRISGQMDEFSEQIEYHQREIACLHRKIRELRWQAIEDGDGEIAFYDDVTSI